VGKARILRHDAVEVRLRWLGAILLLLVVIAAGYLTVRYFGLRAGWWTTLLPIREASAAAHAFISSVHSFFARFVAWLNS
jgi:hypothetical protein